MPRPGSYIVLIPDAEGQVNGPIHLPRGYVGRRIELLRGTACELGKGIIFVLGGVILELEWCLTCLAHYNGDSQQSANQ